MKISYFLLSAIGVAAPKGVFHQKIFLHFISQALIKLIPEAKKRDHTELPAFLY